MKAWIFPLTQLKKKICYAKVNVYLLFFNEEVKIMRWWNMWKVNLINVSLRNDILDLLKKKFRDPLWRKGSIEWGSGA